MKRVLRRPLNRQHGQILPLTLAGVALAGLLMFVMASTGNKITEKSVVTNAADAAAYSGSTLLAQQLNFMAYTNRAMIANHIGVGHFVAYLSWVRYIEEVAERADDIGQFVPFLAPVTQALEQFAEVIQELAEITAGIFVPGVDALNLFYSAAQTEAFAIFNFSAAATEDSPLQGVMTDVAQTFDPNISINNPQEMSKLGSDGSAELLAAQLLQIEKVVNFIKPVNVTDNNGELVDLVRGTYGDQSGVSSSTPRGNMSRKWLTEREWRDGNLDKEFETEHTLNDEEANWETEDTLKLTTFTGSRRLASEDAEAREDEVAPNYRGIRGYHTVVEPTIFDTFFGDTGVRRLEGRDLKLPIMAFASKSQQNVFTHDVSGATSSDIPLAGLSIAVVEFSRPSVFNRLVSGQLGSADVVAAAEYSNLYNPFWRGRLIGTRYADLALFDPSLTLLDPDNY